MHGIETVCNRNPYTGKFTPKYNPKQQAPPVPSPPQILPKPSPQQILPLTLPVQDSSSEDDDSEDYTDEEPALNNKENAKPRPPPFTQKPAMLKKRTDKKVRIVKTPSLKVKGVVNFELTDHHLRTIADYVLADVENMRKISNVVLGHMAKNLKQNKK